MFVTDAEFKNRRKSLRIPIKKCGNSQSHHLGKQQDKSSHYMGHACGLQKSMMLTHSVSCLNDIKLGYQHCILLHLTPSNTKPLVVLPKCHVTCPVWSGLRYLPQFHGLEIQPLNPLSPNLASPKWLTFLLKWDLRYKSSNYSWSVSMRFQYILWRDQEKGACRVAE
jgi:hypothetical protein